MRPTVEIRNPKAEGRRKAENRNPKGPASESHGLSAYES